MSFGFAAVLQSKWPKALKITLRATAILAALTASCAPGLAAEDMSFRIVEVGTPSQCARSCPQVIAADGQITDQTPEQFRAFVREHATRADLHAIVLLDSYGGKVLAAMELGTIFRTIGAAVVVAQPGAGRHTGGTCFSACVYALIGGQKRVVPPESRVGVHRMIAYESRAEQFFSEDSSGFRVDDGAVASALSRYSMKMGVDPAVIALAEHTAPGSLHILSRAEISRWRLAASRL